MTKYRIRLANGRVIGPFEKHQLFELKAKGHIKGNEEAQVFPTGNWEPLSSFDFFEDLNDDNKTILQSKPTNDEQTFVIDLEKLRSKKIEKELEAIDHSTIAPVEALTETIRMAPPAPKVEPKVEEVKEPSLQIEKFPDFSVADDVPPLELELAELNDEKESYDKTLINPVAQEEIEKMRRQQKREDERKKSEEEKLRKEKEELLPVPVEEERAIVRSDEATQMIKVNGLDLLSTANEAEVEIEKEFRLARKRERERANEEDDEDEESSDVSKKKKKKILVIAVILALAYALLFPDEEEAKPNFVNLEPDIVFPIPFDQADPQKSKAEFNRGIELFNGGTYPHVVKSGVNFKVSYENDLDNTQALNYMIRSYAEQLKNSSAMMDDANTIFKVIQSKKPYLLTDPNGAIGLNLFYTAINKNDAAIDVVQKYLKLNPKNVTQDLFAVYLRSLIKQGKLDLARQFREALLKAPEKNKYNYEALIEYSLLNQEIEAAKEYVDEAIKRHPKSVVFYLLKAELLLKEKKLDDVVPLLKKAEAMNLESNNQLRAKFLELKGLYLALKGKPEQATGILLESLKITESLELRMKLADLSASGEATNETTKLINESKSIKFLSQAKEFFEKKNYELALSHAAKASDISPGYIPSELFLAKVQLKLGLAKESLKTLETLANKYPEDKTVNLALIETFVDTYKFKDARSRIQLISSAEYKTSWEYASVNAKLYLKMGDLLQGMSWLQTSVSANPLNDRDIFLLSEIYQRRGGYDNARMMLNKCIELDPLNPDYRIAYARLIYETQDDEAAIGYLLSLKDEFGEHPKVLSEIAILYYRAGKVKDYQDVRAKLEKDHSTDKALYEFLLKAALLDEKHDEIPFLVEKLLALEPGDLEAMMTAGRVLFEEGKLVESAKWFKRVQDKLPSYPKVLYYSAKIDYLSKDIDGAMKKIQKDMEENGENDADLVFMAQLYAEKEDFIQAENIFKKAQKLNPRSYDAIVGLADLSTKRNNHDLALDLYKRAMKLKSDEPLVHKKIGDVYRQLGQGTLAIEAYKMYLEMEPESPHKSNLEAYINLMK